MAQWNLGEARLIQERAASSGAGATSVSFVLAPVPQGKVWQIIGFGYYPSVAETKVISIEKTTRSGGVVGVLNPISLNLNPAIATYIEQGMEYTLYPGEYMTVRRDSATAGSTMYAMIQFVEIDLPLYTYDEPQVVKRQERAISSIRQRMGGGTTSITRPPSDYGRSGGRTGPLPK